jgi:signal transduction histidine kinase
LSKEAVYAAVREAALTLLRGEDCLILEIESELQVPAENCIQNISIVSRLTSHVSPPVYSHTIVQRALEAARPVVVSEGLPESATESVVLSEARSILCAPIQVRGEAVCCFYVTHRQVGGLFGEEEERLAAYIATLAGAALENAEGFARVEAMSRSLEQQVEERTSALSESNRELEASVENLQNAQQQLRQSDKMAAMGALVAGLSHELNNPLTAVIGFAEVLLGSALSPEARSHVECILSQGTRCAELIQRLMDFSRGSSPTLETVDLNALIRPTLDLKRYALRTDGIELQVDLQGGLPPVRVDRHQIRQVFLNLLNNAHEALMRRDGEKRLRVCTERIGEMLRVVVEDSGIGIPEEMQSRVFEPFFTTKPAGEGRGLGLSISYGILQSHGGGINFDSREGEGSRFWFDLPISHKE